MICYICRTHIQWPRLILRNIEVPHSGSVYYLCSINCTEKLLDVLEEQQKGNEEDDGLIPIRG